jgi:hypothetical protein
MSTQQPLTYQALVSLAAADPAVVGLVLFGSQAHEGMVTSYSDHDVSVILADGATTDLTGQRTSELDFGISSLAEFRAAGMPGGKECLHLTMACNHSYNKYLTWELDRYPLPGWDTGKLLDAVDRIARTGDVSLQRRLFARVEATARQAGHSEVLDAWGEDLELMRPH